MSVRWRATGGRHAVALVAAAALLAACGGGIKNDPILQLSAEESLEQGKALFESGKYARSREYLTHAFEVEPNSIAGRTALLMVADSHFQDGGFDNFVKAEAKYRDFQNRFPTSERSDFVQFQIGNSLSERMERPDRDQTITRKGLEAYRDLITLFPTSSYVPEAREKIQVVRNRLAEHEYLIGHFYMRFRLPVAAVGRLEEVIEEYPDFEQMDLVYFDLGKAYMQTNRLDDATATFDLLRSQYPDSRAVSEIDNYVRKQSKKLAKSKEKRESAKPSKQERKLARMQKKREEEERKQAARAEPVAEEAAASDGGEEAPADPTQEKEDSP